MAHPALGCSCRIIRLRHLFWQAAGGFFVMFNRWRLAQRFMGTLGVIFMAEGLKGFLLFCGVGTWILCERQKCQMEALMTSVLLGLAWSDAFQRNAELDEALGQAGKPVTPALAKGEPLSVRILSGRP